MSQIKVGLTALLILASSCWTTVVHALEVDTTLGLSSTWEDNVFRSSTNRQDDFENSLRLEVDAEEDQTRHNYGIEYSLEYVWYNDDSFDRTTFLDGTAYLDFSIVERRLLWNNQIDSAVTLRDSTQPNVTDNRDQRNSIYTSPELYIMNTQKNVLTFSAYASRISFREATENDSNRFGVNGSFMHNFTSLLSSGFTCMGDKVNFENAEDYESHSCMLNVVKRFNGGSIQIDLGASRIEPEVSDPIDGRIYNIRLDWGREGRSVYMYSQRYITDTSIGLFYSGFSDDGLTPVDVNTDEALLTTRTRTEFGWDQRISSERFNLSGFLYRDLDDIASREEDTLREGTVVNFESRHPNDISLILSYSFEKTQFDEEGDSSVDYVNNYSFRILKEFSRRLVSSLFLSAEDRRADLPVDEYEVYGVGVDVNYTF